jgi:hypothetical protein
MLVVLIFVELAMGLAASGDVGSGKVGSIRTLRLFRFMRALRGLRAVRLIKMMATKKVDMATQVRLYLRFSVLRLTCTLRNESSP